jgi:hypothetical protein
MKPRRPYGNPPGRLPATMIKVLAAELSDQGRLARGKRYWADNAVTDIVIGHGAVTAEIQGSRPDPYIVTVTTLPGRGVPGKRDVTLRCTCPDDGMYEACKHAVAALFALSDEVAVEPELLDRWRGGSAAPPASDPAQPERQPGLADVVPIRRRFDREAPDATTAPAPPTAAPRDPMLDEIARLLAAPNGSLAPELPEVESIEHTGIRDRLLAEVLLDALHHLDVAWD